MFVVTVTTVLRDCPTLFCFYVGIPFFVSRVPRGCFKCLVDITLLSYFFWGGEMIMLIFLSVFYRFLSQHRKQKGF